MHQTVNSLTTILSLLMATITLIGCHSSKSLVYRISISQGNYIEQNDVNQLRLGMSKKQVRYIIGSPMLIEHNHPNTWYYIHYTSSGQDKPIQKNLAVNFNSSEELTSVTGDFQISKRFFEKIHQ
ncbi:small protein A [Candidatus Photodesmus blepharus]|uniref:Outer membrane protein assembly factor BamE n=1 Tax=Candidatus Photodesmus blepharonis TaxID=1179155 RepID=A0A084CPE6_9GAMM|nr:outer membrane protein assembly factor BamE [Candidatus Photodesmus blepharus]KEY91675.1 small protein A [Candidatus Photodesmus blepharus]